MDLSGSWQYIQNTARNRLAHNKTAYHHYELGDGAEVIGVAGELVARQFLSMPMHVHEGFDGGVDIIWGGWKIDVKTTILTPNFQYRFLQWPQWKRVVADIILMTAVDPITQLGVVVGFATREEITTAVINQTRRQPCHEIPVHQLHPLWELYTKRSDVGM